MSLDDDIRILGTVSLFGSFTDEQLRLLAFGAERFVLRDKRELCREGQSADCAYVIVSGSIRLYHERAGEQMMVCSVGATEIVGEMALIAKTTWQTHASAEGETDVIRLSRSIFHRILEEYPNIAVALHAHIRRRFTKFVQKIEELSPFFEE